MDLGCGGFYGVNQTAFGVYADMGFHTEIPLVALLCLAHIGVAFVCLVLGRGRCRNQGGIHDRATAHQQGLFLQIAGNCLKQHFCQVVPLKQVAEIKNGRFVRNGIMCQIKPGEFTHAMHVVKCFFGTWVGQVIPLLLRTAVQTGDLSAI